VKTLYRPSPHRDLTSIVPYWVPLQRSGLLVQIKPGFHELLKVPGARINASGELERKSRSGRPGPEGGPMAYYKVLIEVWCGWDPEGSDLEEMARHVLLGEDAICTLQEVVKVVDRPQDIDNEVAMIFFGGQEGDADQSQG
jgi:hypothetical protein